MEDRAKVLFKTCSRGMDFKKEAGEMCNCAVEAGVRYSIFVNTG